MPSSSSSWILSLKLLLISTAIISIAVTIKLTVPLISTALPAIWSTVVTWLKPPYLYVVINGIIITIAATTRFQHNNHHENQSQPQVFNAPPPSDLPSELPPVSIPPSYGVMEVPPVSYDGEPSVTVVDPPVVFESKRADVDLDTVAVSGSEVVGVNEDEFVTLGDTWNMSESVVDSPSLVQPEFNLPVKEKQPVTSRLVNNRKPAKAGPEGGRALRVLKPKKHETLESTWKMITDGRQLPLTRDFRKSDAFDNLDNDCPSEESATAAKTKVAKKSETFKERTTTYANQNVYPQPPLAAGKLKKDVSLGQDELNQRVEAFIKKFNDNMRLQRQESLKQYMEMVKSGAR